MRTQDEDNLEGRKLMSRVARAAVFVWIAATGNLALSQANACANPNAPRIGLIIRDNTTPSAPAPAPELVAALSRLAAAETNFRDQLARRLPASACVVTDRGIFNDPKNFPQLKGSTIFEISADGSPKNPSVFALAVTVSAAEGIYAQDQLRLFTMPVLIETESDYASGADAVMKHWQSFGEAFDRDHGK
jgi:hypothetical protein